MGEKINTHKQITANLPRFIVNISRWDCWLLSGWKNADGARPGRGEKWVGTYLWPLRSRSPESPPPERGTLKLAVCRTLGTARGEGEGRLTFSGLGNPERSVLRAPLSREERGLRCLSARLRGGRWSRDSDAGRAVSAAFGAEKEESSVG